VVAVMDLTEKRLLHFIVLSYVSVIKHTKLEICGASVGVGRTVGEDVDNFLSLFSKLLFVPASLMIFTENTIIVDKFNAFCT
jgi:hypothetical protein